METKDLVFNERCQWEIVKEVSEIFPHRGVSILAKTLVIKAVDLSDLSGLMVSSEDCDSIFESNLQSDKKRDGFHRVIASVHVVP